MNHHHDLCAAMAKALLPLANVARAIDEPLCIERMGVRPDNAPIWCANTQHMSAVDLTMGHARAARHALDAWLSREIERNANDGLPADPIERIAFAMGMTPEALQPLLARLYDAGGEVVFKRR